MPRRILIATGNPGKLREIVRVLADALPDAASRPECISIADLPNAPPEPKETEPAFEGNARLKAVYYARATGLWTLADDSGLKVDALHGEPGVRSARFANVTGERRAVDLANNRLLINRLRGVPPALRTARFRCVLALAHGESVLAQTQGVIEGRIIDEPRGSAGFGYDPHFFVDSAGCTTAELPADEKNRISHRGQAVRAMAAHLRRLLECAV